MTQCSDLEEQLSLFVDDLLDDGEAATVREHVAHCAACAGLLADLAGIASTARRLGPVAPPEHVYARLIAQLPNASPGSGTPPPRPRFLWQWAGIAASAIAAAGLVWLAIGIGQPAASRVTSEPALADGSDTVTVEFEAAVGHYERAVSDLETVATASEGTLDEDVSAAMRSGLTTLDRAIAESRGALDVDPASEAARITLFEALRRKVDLLQTTVLIVNDTNQTEAARPVPTTEREL